jgi:two-component system, OmpR family, response regulator
MLGHMTTLSTPTRALVVDDSPLIREVARLALAAADGWDVETAESGEEAVAAARANPPDVIVLDVVMPGLDGPQTLARLREYPATREVPVVFATAEDRPDEQARLAALGVAGVMAKPFDLAGLPAQLAGLLGRH